MYYEAREDSVTEKNIKQAFAKTGIFPFDPSKIGSKSAGPSRPLVASRETSKASLASLIAELPLSTRTEAASLTSAEPVLAEAASEEEESSSSDEEDPHARPENDGSLDRLLEVAEAVQDQISAVAIPNAPNSDAQLLRDALANIQQAYDLDENLDPALAAQTRKHALGAAFHLLNDVSSEATIWRRQAVSLQAANVQLQERKKTKRIKIPFGKSRILTEDAAIAALEEHDQTQETKKQEAAARKAATAEKKQARELERQQKEAKQDEDRAKRNAARAQKGLPPLPQLKRERAALQPQNSNVA
jgi:hypothetical protein